MQDAKAALALRLAKGKISKTEYHDLLQTISQTSTIAPPINESHDMQEAKAALALRLAKGEISKTEYHDLLETISETSPIVPAITHVVPLAPAFEPVTFTDLERERLYNSRSKAFAVDFVIGIAVLIGVCYIGSELRFDQTGVGFLCLVLIGSTYLLIKDALPQGRSIGKILSGLRTVQVETRRPCGVVRSVVRNFLLWLWILGPLFTYVLIELFFIEVLNLYPGGVIKGFVIAGIMGMIYSEGRRIREDIHGLKRTDKWTGTQVIFADERNT